MIKTIKPPYRGWQKMITLEKAVSWFEKRETLLWHRHYVPWFIETFGQFVDYLKQDLGYRIL